MGGCIGALVGLPLAFGIAMAVVLGVISVFVLLFDGRFGLAAAIVGAALLTLLTASSLYERSQAAERAKPLGARVAVGSDGVAFRRGRTSEFHPWSELREVRRRGSDHVVMHLRSGALREFCVRNAAELERALIDGKRRYDRAERSAALRAFEPAPELDAEWVERARDAMEPRGYRVESPDRDAVLAVLEDPAQTAAQRLGAALALSDAAGSSQTRVRVAIEDTADPELSLALEEAANGALQPTTLRRMNRR